MAASASAPTTKNYSGDHLRGSYVGGVYYPDKTKVGWWKNGYPEYFAKVLNAPDWTTIRVRRQRRGTRPGQVQQPRQFSADPRHAHRPAHAVL